MKTTVSLWLGVATAAAVVVGAIAGCSDSTDTSYRAPDEAGSHDAAHASGGASSKGDGATAHTGGALSAGGSSHSDAGADGAVTALPIGDYCKTDADCAPGLTCLKSSDTIPNVKGGPAGGLCTKECTPDTADAGAAAAATCTALNPLAKCVRFDSTSLKAYCFMACLPGQGTFQCARPDQACAPLASGIDGFCQPVCGSDADCGGGRVCDFSTGYCTDPKSSKGAPIGTACGTGSALEKSGGHCDGFCLSITTSPTATPISICSGACVYGELGCGTSVTSSGTGIPGEGVCAIPLSPFSGPFDLGYCAESCACDSDCSAGTICWNFLIKPISGLKDGACMPPTLFGQTLPGTPCSDAGRDAGSPKGDAGRTISDASAADRG